MADEIPKPRSPKGKFDCPVTLFTKKQTRHHLNINDGYLAMNLKKNKNTLA